MKNFVSLQKIMDIKQYTDDAVELLKQLISTPRVSRQEADAATVFTHFIEKWGLPYQRIGNNILIQETLDEGKPTLLLNAHIDTVKPVQTCCRHTEYCEAEPRSTIWCSWPLAKKR